MLKSKFYATLENGKTVDLPYTYDTLQQAASWLDNHNNTVSMHERMAVYDSQGERTYKTYDVTENCLDILSVR
jgi:hypothetical protein